MNDKFNKELEKSRYSKINTAPLLVIVGVAIIIGIFIALPESEKLPSEKSTTKVVEKRVLSMPLNDREWSAPVPVPYGHCIKWYEQVKGTDTFVTQVLPHSSKKWVYWSDIRDGPRVLFDSVRFKSRKGQTIALYEFGNKGQCN